MRFFKVTVEIFQQPEEQDRFYLRDEDAHDGPSVWENSSRFASQDDDLPELYDELGRQAIAKFMSEGRNMTRSNKPYVGITLVDPRSGVADVKDLALKAIELWGFVLPAHSRLQVAEDLAANVIGRSSMWTSVGNGSPVYDTGLYLLGFLARRQQGFFGERILKAPLSVQEAKKLAERTSFKNALGKELERISQTPLESAPSEVALHYIISGSTNQERREALRLLLASLQSAGRLSTDHVFEFDIDRVLDRAPMEYDVIESCGLDVLGEALRGNVVVLSYGLHDNGDTYDKNYYDVFTKIISTLRPYLSSIQLVVVIPSQSQELDSRVRRLLGVPCVSLKSDGAPMSNLTFEQGWKYLESKVQNESLAVDGRLEALLRARLEDKSFSDLDGLFDEWRTKSLVAARLPAYLPEVRACYDRDAGGKGESLSASQQLEELVGLGEVKTLIRSQIARCKVAREAAAAGLPAVEVSYHMAFEGNPGTGKTEVARLYGEILKEQGLLKEGRVISTTGGSFKRELLEKAVGSVLFIDEAYDFNWGSIAELIAFMENHREDTVVILAGYTASIERFLDCNLGFRSRLGATVRFPDYKPQELQEIFRLMVRRAKLELTVEADAKMCEAFTRRGRKASQGNGRYARKLFEDVLGAQQVRLAKEQPEGGYELEDLKTLKECDVLSVTQTHKPSKPALERLDEMVGLGLVKKQVCAFLTEARYQRLLRERKKQVTPISLHMAFMGNPGTGKTEVARLVAEVLGDAGMLSEGGLIEVTGTELARSFFGISPYFEDARGNVLFIDEAYALAGYSNKVAELISCMENYRDDVVVILAGYTLEIMQLLDTNPGFDSRIKTKIQFMDYTADELVEILKLQAARAGFTLAPGVSEKVYPFMERARNQRGFGNGRMVRNLLEDARTRQALRLMGDGSGGDACLSETLTDEELTRLEPEDFYDPSTDLKVGPKKDRPMVGF